MPLTEEEKKKILDGATDAFKKVIDELSESCPPEEKAEESPEAEKKEEDKPAEGE